VFGAGTIQWSWGLDANHDRNPSTPSVAMQQATVNLLADMVQQSLNLFAFCDCRMQRGLDGVPLILTQRFK
jgi:hypothetical protein